MLGVSWKFHNQDDVDGPVEEHLNVIKQATIHAKAEQAWFENENLKINMELIQPNQTMKVTN